MTDDEIKALQDVSIHALLAECDRRRIWPHDVERSFNPRTPCGVRPAFTACTMVTLWFQSTHSLRSATCGVDESTISRWVSIHALLAECDLCRDTLPPVAERFNPRTPCGVRLRPAPTRSDRSGFQSTHSLRSATQNKIKNAAAAKVSIHALLAECDRVWTRRRKCSASFNPRTPCGVRPTNTGLPSG